MPGPSSRGTPRTRCLALLMPVCALALATLSACSGNGAAVQVAERAFRIEGPGLPSVSDAPNRRVAERVCPLGYRVLDQTVRRNSPDGIREESGMFTNWTIRCI
jgi:hypothetical protein